MSTLQFHPGERWMNPLVTLLNRWHALDRKGWQAFEDVLLAKLRNANCYQLIHWLLGAEAPSLTPDAQAVAPRVVLEALEQHAYDDPQVTGVLSEAHRRELQRLRSDVIGAARAAVIPSDFPWEGDDWDAQPRLIRRLLTYMHGRREADLENVFPEVWERKYVAGKSDVSLALSRANAFLAERKSPRELRKKRGESVIYWD